MDVICQADVHQRVMDRNGRGEGSLTQGASRSYASGQSVADGRATGMSADAPEKGPSLITHRALLQSQEGCRLRRLDAIDACRAHVTMYKRGRP